jgi:hypothetical protein
MSRSHPTEVVLLLRALLPGVSFVIQSLAAGEHMVLLRFHLTEIVSPLGAHMSGARLINRSLTV